MAYRYASQNYYAEERKIYSEGYSTFVSDAKALKIVRRLAKHYNRSNIPVSFYGNRQSGLAGYRGIRLSHDPSVALIIHEFCHYCKYEIIKKHNLTLQNQGTDHHGTKFQACLNYVHQYAKSKGYWKTMIDPVEKTRLKALEPKPVVSPVEEKQKEIERIEKKIELYEKRLKYFTKLYTTKLKKAKRSLSAYHRSLNKVQSQITTPIVTPPATPEPTPATPIETEPTP